MDDKRLDGWAYEWAVQKQLLELALTHLWILVFKVGGKVEEDEEDEWGGINRLEK